eukprot:scaffold102364_cov16-Tisochrysis_lutea.AAC.1
MAERAVAHEEAVSPTREESRGNRLYLARQIAQLAVRSSQKQVAVKAGGSCLKKSGAVTAEDRKHWQKQLEQKAVRAKAEGRKQAAVRGSQQSRQKAVRAKLEDRKQSGQKAHRRRAGAVRCIGQKQSEGSQGKG